jgi:hypothetical protein
MAREPLAGGGIAGPDGVAELFGLAAQLAEMVACWQRIGHGVSLRRLRSAAQAEEEPRQPGQPDSEVDTVLPADPAAPSKRRQSS